MVKVDVLYPNEEGKTFDLTYYIDKHIPMVKHLLGDTCKNVTVEKGMAGEAPGSPAPYVVMGHLYFDSVEDFISSFGLHAGAITGDIPNYTAIKPVVQISEVII